MKPRDNVLVEVLLKFLDLDATAPSGLRWRERPVHTSRAMESVGQSGRAKFGTNASQESQPVRERGVTGWLIFK
jgi:hypothetical protein